MKENYKLFRKLLKQKYTVELDASRAVAKVWVNDKRKKPKLFNLTDQLECKEFYMYMP